MKEICTIRVEMDGAEWGGEDIVKNIWPFMVPWFTRRHGTESGAITLDNVSCTHNERARVTVSWKYETIEPFGPDNADD